MYNNSFYNNSYKSNAPSIEFLKQNYKQIILLILVFVIIFIVEYITYINTVFYGIVTKSVIPGVTNAITPQIPKQSKTTKRKKN